MNAPRSCKERIDYKTLHESGAKTLKNVDVKEVDEISELLENFNFGDKMTSDNKDRLLLAKIDDINDFFDDNEIKENIRLPEIESRTLKLEGLRSSLRILLHEVKPVVSEEVWENKFSILVEKTLAEIKFYLKTLREKKDEIFERSEKQTIKQEIDLKRNIDQKIQAASFTINDITRILKELSIEFSMSDEPSNEDLDQRNKNFPESSKKFEKLAKRLQNLLETIPPDFPDKTRNIEKLMKEYELLNENKDLYQTRLKSMIEKRDLLKEKTFQTSKLNIKLEKFKNYESKLDIYTFKSNFEKLHLESVPAHNLPDMLRNNYLEDPALSLVEGLTDINEIWKRLKESFGDPKSMLQKRLAVVRKMGPLWKIKNPESLKNALSKLICALRDLIRLASEHNIENRLYYGDGLQIIYQSMGDARLTKFLNSIYDKNFDEKARWNELLKFLEKEMKVQQEKTLVVPNYDENFRKRDEKPQSRTSNFSYSSNSIPICAYCGESDDHTPTNGPNGTKIINYFACRKFVESTPTERFHVIRNKGFCVQCLYPGAKQDRGKHADGTCQNEFACMHQYHDRFPIKKHVLLCHDHRDTETNKTILQKYKEKYILRQKIPIPEYSKNLKISFHSQASYTSSRSSGKIEEDGVIFDDAIYMLQTIKIDGQLYTLFFDSGCGDLVCRFDAVKRIGDRAVQEHPGPIVLGGVGDLQTTSAHGVYTIKLPLHNKNEASLTGVCLDQITHVMPMYPLKGKVSSDIAAAYESIGGKLRDLPKLPESVGGQTDFMVGIKYLRYYPEKIFTLPSGLSIYRSMFENSTGGRGVIGGPHPIFTQINQFHRQNHDISNHHTTYLSQQYSLFRHGYQINPDIKLSAHEFHLCEQDEDTKNYKVQTLDLFDSVENAGSEISYRCVDCRSCKKCKSGEKIESISLREEVEQEIINNSIKIDESKQVVIAKLPFIDSPSKLMPNKTKALSVYNSQLRKLNKLPQDKEDVIKSEAKLQNLGYVDYVKNLTPEQQRILETSPVKNFIPWRAVWHPSSLSTPCRVVFDASQPTGSGVSLNNILAKGKNNMNKLVEIIIRWFSHKTAFHTDISKMYNTVKLEESDWCFQRYIWEANLDPTKLPEEKIVKTLIYGLKSSGNQSEHALREIAKLSQSEFPEVCSMVNNDFYVDDCLSGEQSKQDAYTLADNLTKILSRGGFTLKGFTFSNEKPIEKLSNDGRSVCVAGMKWFPEEDEICLDVAELNFSKKSRGRKPESCNEIPEQLTRRHCVGKVAEVFDITGKVTPLTARFKVDLHELSRRKLDWDDVIPDDLRQVWKNNFEMMQEINSIHFKRAIVPDDAENLFVETIDAGDASESIACSAIYARYLKKDGSYSCQLIFARSKIIPDGTTQPRGELLAATLTAHTGFVVKRALSKYHKDFVKLTDSQIVLHWIGNKEKPLKAWVRNRVIEILRFSLPTDWRYVRSEDMIADIGTRRGADIADVSPGAVWIEGYDWMKLDKEKFPVMTLDEINLSSIEISEVQKESKVVVTASSNHSYLKVSDAVISRYAFSNYIIDPNRRRFRTVVRILALVYRFIRNCKKCKRRRSPRSSSVIQSSLIITENEMNEARMYFWKKATAEVKQFVPPKSYAQKSKEVNGVLRYTGRILPTQEFVVSAGMTDVMLDLTSSTFFVPLVDRHSPIAYSLVDEIHWYHPVANHSGVETVYRYLLQFAYVLEGRELVKLIRKNCERCRFILKRTLEVSMGAVSKYNLVIAPAFYVCQIDLAGPFKAYSLLNRRATIRIWYLVICCTTTSAINIKVMEDYSTTGFIMAFTRFACEAGYPKVVLPDEGSQLISACKNMLFSFKDLAGRLYKDMNIDFQSCPVGGHFMHGKVERKIRQVKESIEKTVHLQRLSILQWETLGAEIANAINDLPLAVGDVKGDFESIDLLTPNRLRLGRNNDRSPIGPVTVTNRPDKLLKSNAEIFNAWFESWLISHVPKLMKQPKWFRDDRDVTIGDIVLFLKNSDLAGQYQYGRIVDTEMGRDDRIRTVTVRYRNSNEETDRTTRRAVRELVVIHKVEELAIHTELYEYSLKADMLVGECIHHA